MPEDGRCKPIIIISRVVQFVVLPDYHLCENMRQFGMQLWDDHRANTHAAVHLTPPCGKKEVQAPWTSPARRSLSRAGKVNDWPWTTPRKTCSGSHVSRSSISVQNRFVELQRHDDDHNALSCSDAVDALPCVGTAFRVPQKKKKWVPKFKNENRQSPFELSDDCFTGVPAKPAESSLSDAGSLPTVEKTGFGTSSSDAGLLPSGDEFSIELSDDCFTGECANPASETLNECKEQNEDCFTGEFARPADGTLALRKVQYDTAALLVKAKEEVAFLTAKLRHVTIKLNAVEKPCVAVDAFAKTGNG